MRGSQAHDRWPHPSVAPSGQRHEYIYDAREQLPLIGTSPRAVDPNKPMLVAYLRDALQENLPADLVAGAEEEAVTIGANRAANIYRPQTVVCLEWGAIAGRSEKHALPIGVPPTNPINAGMKGQPLALSARRRHYVNIE